MAVTARSGGLHLGTTRLNPILRWSQRNGIFFALVFLVVYFSIASARFFTSANLEVILLQVAVVGILAIPGAMLLLAGYVDLSVGSVVVLSSAAFGQFVQAGVPVLWAALLTGALATVWGIANGVLIAVLDFSPIIVTLGGLAGARGLAELISQGSTTFSFGDGFATLGNGEPLGLPLPVWIFAGVFLLGAWFWYITPYGRHMTAIGADKHAARALGIGVRRIPFILYAASGFAAGLGGLILTSQLDAASLSIGLGLELEVLTAILLGGVAFTGGRGSLLGVLFGILFIGVLTNGLIVINVGLFYEGVAIGGALVLAAGLEVLYRRMDRVVIRDEDEPEPTVGVVGDGRA